MHRIAMRGKLLILVAVILCLGGGVGGQSPRQSETAKRLIGTWRLVSIVGGTAEAIANRGAHPTGLFIFDATGHCAIQIMPDRVRPKYAQFELPTPDEARTAILGYVANFGAYTLDDRTQTLTVRREGSVDAGGLGDYMRHYELAAGDRLIVTPPENTGILTFERIEVDGQSPRPSETAKRLVGAWRLVSTEGGSTRRGAHHSGWFVFDATGHFGVQIMYDPDRPKYAGTLPTPDQARAAIIGYGAEFGTYTLDERSQVATVHRVGSLDPGKLGDYMRHYELETDDRLILAPLEGSSHLIFERIK